MTVSRAALDAALEDARDRCADRTAGLYGPGSVSWRVSRESALFLAAGRAALLQLAHPYVAYAVDEHSETRRDPIGRFNRTFMNVYAMVFGGLDDATSAARRVYNIHTRVTGEIGEDVGPYARGHRYEANDEDALLWVFATLVDSAVMAYELIVAPLSREDREQHYRESRSFARLFGIERAPETWEDFQTYCRGMHGSAELTVCRPGRELGRFLLTPPHRAAVPFSRWYALMTAGLMPEPLREPFGLRFGRRERRVYDGSIRALRRAYPALPRRLRYVPAYFEAKRRLAGLEGPDRFGRALERLVLRGVAPPRRAEGCPVHR